MRHFISTLILAGLYCHAFGQDYKKTFDQYIEQGDTTKQLEVLTQWEAVDPHNSELYTSYFNYYFLKSRQEILTLTNDQPQGESLAIQDSSGNNAGFMGSQIIYDPEMAQKGLDKINEGISRYPNRLDMRFGKIYVLGQIENWDSFTEEIIQTIRYSTQNDNKWTWTNNEPVEDEGLFLDALQDYQLQLYRADDQNLLASIRDIAEEILKIHPDHIQSLTNIGNTYLIAEEYKKGLKMLRRAEKVNPEDTIVLNNIAYVYELQGKTKKALKYYEKLEDYGDEETVEFARSKIEELKK